MAAVDHVRAAVGELRNAAVALRQEAADLLNYKEHTNRQKSNDASHAHFRLKAKQLELGAQNLSDHVKQQIASDIKDLERHISNMQQEMDQLTKEATELANRKHAQARSLDSYVAELERLEIQL